MNTGKTGGQDLLWHTLTLDTVFQQLRASREGLSSSEARSRLDAYGPNRLTPPKKRSPVTRFLLQFNNVLIYVLLAAAFVTIVIDHLVDAGVIIGVVIINALIGFIQEGKAERALDAIRSMLSTQASVMRDGKHLTLAAEELVPGDTVLLQSGDKVPADIRLFRVRELRIDEAALTGESFPVEKSIAPVHEHVVVGDRTCMVFSGTLVTYGQGAGVVVASGDTTEIGKINLLLKKVRPLSTKLLRQIAEFGRVLTIAIATIATATFTFGVFARNYGVTEMFLACVGLAVAAIPEGLPAIITITLAVGVQQMAKRKAIIRRLPAVESLGAVTVICSDKTGTLTRNEMAVRSIFTAESCFEVTGEGYEPHGDFLLNGQDVVPADYPVLTEVLKAALLCNDSELQEQEECWCPAGDPTEAALLTMARKGGLDPAYETEQFPRTDSIPFESEHRFMATLHHDHAGHGFVYVKGAPERILAMCNKERRYGEDRPLNISYWHRRTDAIAAQGQRMLAIAFRTATDRERELNFADVEGGLTLLGIVGMMDPPRCEAIEAVQECRSAGIRVKMITGDHAVTAASIGHQMGIGDGMSSITGLELDDMGEDELRTTVEKVDIFARVSPEHKMRLVQSLQANGEIVAMTGDGVNDAPALKRADVGVSMGLKGTEVSKEASEMVLADDNFASIASAITEGRTVDDNIQKSIAFILPTNGGEAGMIIAAVLSGQVLPITPVQILWVNMITAVTLALSLAFEPAEPGVMRRRPQDPKEPILSHFLIWRIFFVSTILVMGTFGLFLWARLNEVPIEEARTIAVNTLVLFEVFYLLNTRHLRNSVLNRQGLLGNRAVHIAIVIVMAAQLLYTYTPVMQRLFGSAPVNMETWLSMGLVASTVFILVEVEKFFLHIWVKKRKAAAEHPLSNI